MIFYNLYSDRDWNEKIGNRWKYHIVSYTEDIKFVSLSVRSNKNFTEWIPDAIFGIAMSENIIAVVHDWNIIRF